MEVPAEIHTNSGRNVWKSWICLLMFVVHAVIIWWRSNLSWVCEREWNYILCRKKEKMSPECKWSIWPVRSCWWLQDTGSIKFTSQSPSFQCRNCFIKSTKGPENLQQATLFGFPFTTVPPLFVIWGHISTCWFMPCHLSHIVRTFLTTMWDILCPFMSYPGPRTRWSSNVNWAARSAAFHPGLPWTAPRGSKFETARDHKGATNMGPVWIAKDLPNPIFKLL